MAVASSTEVSRARNVQEVPGFERVEPFPSWPVVSGLVSSLVRENAAVGEKARIPVRPVSDRAGQPSDLGLPGRVEKLVRDPTDDAVTVLPQADASATKMTR